MNIKKSLVIASVSALALVAGYHAASAGGAPAPAPAPEGGICHDQPNMTAALQSLRAARASLDKAEHNKGGWRAAAIEKANAAIAETERGCAFADK
jgi:hypothetical protein